jgi:hypothetical protein
MLSYSWADSARPELVKALGQTLQAQGIDVWRDETGSSLVGPMSDSTDETMALAVEASSVVVICVSQKYKVSPNCRQEAAYARQLEKKGRMKLVYIMMQEEYTTVSDPESVDGWLGVQLSDKLWFPCWNSQGMAATAAKIVPIVAAQGRATAASFTTSRSPTVNAPRAVTPFAPMTPSAPADPGASASASVPASPLCLAPLEQNVSEPLNRADDLSRATEAIKSPERASASRPATSAAWLESCCAAQSPPIPPPVAASTSHLHGAIETLCQLLTSQQAMQASHQASQQAMQEALISSQRWFQEALAAHQQPRQLQSSAPVATDLAQPAADLLQALSERNLMRHWPCIHRALGVTTLAELRELTGDQVTQELQSLPLLARQRLAKLCDSVQVSPSMGGASGARPSSLGSITSPSPTSLRGAGPGAA